jgi:hypothetical protein
MSATVWIRRQRDRPIAEHERHAALLAVAGFLITVAVLLAITKPTGPAHHKRHHPRAQAAVSTVAGTSRTPISLPVKVTADRFLDGYLRYLYGHGSASAVQGATASFTGSLPVRALGVSPAERSRVPRVLALRVGPGPLGVTAVINDGGLIDYPIPLLLTRSGGRLLVSGLAGA